MLVIAICDDDLIFASSFQKQLKTGFAECGIKCRVETFDNACEFMTALGHSFYDIICLDIEINNDNGIDIGNTIRDKQRNNKSQIIFISSHSSYHQSGRLYGPAPMAFIQKPFKQSDIDNIVAKAKTRVLSGHNALEDKDYYVFEFDRKKHSILKRDIIYIEGNLRTKLIHTDSRDYRVNVSMNKIISALDDSSFLLVHRSFLINIRHIETISSSEVVFKNGFKADVSAVYYKDALWKIAAFWANQAQGVDKND